MLYKRNICSFILHWMSFFLFGDRIICEVNLDESIGCHRKSLKCGFSTVCLAKKVGAIMGNMFPSTSQEPFAIHTYTVLHDMRSNVSCLRP